MGSVGLKLLEIQLFLKRDAMFLKTLSSILSTAIVTGPDIRTNIEADINIFADLLGRGSLRLLHSFTLLWFLSQL